MGKKPGRRLMPTVLTCLSTSGETLSHHTHTHQERDGKLLRQKKSGEGSSSFLSCNNVMGSRLYSISALACSSSSSTALEREILMRDRHLPGGGWSRRALKNKLPYQQFPTPTAIVQPIVVVEYRVHLHSHPPSPILAYTCGGAEQQRAFVSIYHAIVCF